MVLPQPQAVHQEADEELILLHLILSTSHQYKFYSIVGGVGHVPQ
jgi:hypothetical protein